MRAVLREALRRSRSPRKYRKDGLDKTARLMVEFLAAQGIEGATVLEIGGGVGEIEIELLKRGAARAVNLELSPAYEAEVRRHAGRGAPTTASAPSGDSTTSPPTRRRSSRPTSRYRAQPSRLLLSGLRGAARRSGRARPAPGESSVTHDATPSRARSSVRRTSSSGYCAGSSGPFAHPPSALLSVL